MKNELEKILNDLNELTQTDTEYEQLKKYETKLEELEDLIFKYENNGSVDVMLNATQNYSGFRRKIISAPLRDVKYLKNELIKLNWQNTGLKQIKEKELIDLLRNLNQVYKNNAVYVIGVLLSIAGISYQKGNFEKALEYLNQTQILAHNFDKIKPNKKQATIQAELNNMFGLINLALNSFEQALDYFQKSLFFLNFTEDKNNVSTPMITVLNNMGNIYIKQCQWNLAIKHYETHFPLIRLKLKKENSELTKSQIVYLLINMTSCYLKYNQVENAKQKLQILEQLLNDIKQHYPHLYAGFLFSKCKLNCLEYNFEEAIKNIQLSFHFIFPNYSSLDIKENPTIRESDFSKIQALLIQPFGIKAGGLLSWYESNMENLILLEICIDTVDKIAFYFDSVRTNYSGQSTKFSLGFYSKNLYDIGQKACWHLYKKTEDNLYIEKAFAYANNSKALVLLEEMNKKWFNNSEQNISITKIQSQLKDDELLIEYSIGEQGTFVYALTKQNVLSFDYIDKNETNKIGLKIDHWLKHQFNVLSSTKYNEYQKDGYDLYSMLLKSYLNLNISIKKLIIAPDGFLNTLPFDALVTHKNEINNYGDISYVIDQFASAYAFSSYLFYLNRKKKHGDQNSDFLYVSPNFLGNKTLKEHQQIAKEQKALLQKISLTEMNYSSSPVIQYNDKKLNLSLVDDNQQILISKEALLKLINSNNKKEAPQALLYNAALVSIIKNLVDASFNKIKLLNNKQANKTMFKKNADSAKCVLISSHAEEENGILLYDENEQEISFLNYETIRQLDLQAELVILNMCDSGRGKNIFGEGFLSLGRAFFAAGSLNVIQTLYKVSDKYSADLIAAFFSYLIDHKLDYYTALRKAKLLLRKQKGSHPKFWAGHVIYGANGQL